VRRNRLRELIDSGRPSLGTHLLSVWPTLVELIGQSGQFDYVEITAEYAPFDLHSFDNIGRAIELHDHLTGMLKVEQEQRLHQTMRAIGSGIQNVLFADVRTVEDATACVRAVRAETPKARGLHGVGMRRDVGTIREAGTPAFARALDDAVVAIMVEKKACVEDLDAILDVPGIDMVQFGPADYSMSIGLTGQWTHPKVVAAEEKTIETALRKGIHPRVELQNPADAKRYLKMGVQHFCIGWDVTILNEWWRDKGREMREMLAAPKGKARGKRKGNYK
jgi:4-hydroxy-2-oxoheptanedioate aldolase